jgi:hypothetical protein
MDVDNIEPGLDFVRVLEEQVAKCDVLISVIGHDWIGAQDKTGVRCLENPADFVRIEIESALQLGKRVIPVLVGQAEMPRAQDLPDSLKRLATRNAVRLTHERFRSDVQGLIGALQRALKSAEDAREAQAETEPRDSIEKQRKQAKLEPQARKHAQRRREIQAKTQKTEAEQKKANEQKESEAEEKRRTDDEARRTNVNRSAPVLTSRRSVAIASGALFVFLAITGAITYSALHLRQPPSDAVGQLTVTGPDDVSFKGEQGGAFSPAELSLELKATGPGFHWSMVNTASKWLSVTPSQAISPPMVLQQ